MIKRENLKKGNTILIVPNSNYTRDTSISKAEVVGIGPKFITVARKWDDGRYGTPQKFNNDDYMLEKDYSSHRLFLGTEEEYEENKEMEKKARELYNEIHFLLFRDFTYDKLKAIKAIMDSDDLYEAISNLYAEMTLQKNI